jgi:catechol 2,3-dioxygenase
MSDHPAVDAQSLNRPIAAGVAIGHVHLKVADLDRALGFYCGVLGFELTQRFGDSAAFVSAGGYHHHIGLNTWGALAASLLPRERPGCITWRFSIRLALRSPMR